MLEIRSNGSKFWGEKPDSTEKLLEVLDRYPLNRTFEGGFITEEREGCFRFFGNFYTLSHVFNIFTDDQDIIKKLTAAITENQKRPDYISQPNPKKVRRYFYAQDILEAEARGKIINSQGYEVQSKEGV